MTIPECPVCNLPYVPFKEEKLLLNNRATLITAECRVCGKVVRWLKDKDSGKIEDIKTIIE